MVRKMRGLVQNQSKLIKSVTLGSSHQECYRLGQKRFCWGMKPFFENMLGYEKIFVKILLGYETKKHTQLQTVCHYTK